MTEIDYSKLKRWDVIVNTYSQTNYIITNCDTQGCCVVSETGNLSGWFPKSQVIQNFDTLHINYVPHYEILSRIMELVKNFNEKKPTGITVERYIQENWV